MSAKPKLRAGISVKESFPSPVSSVKRLFRSCVFPIAYSFHFSYLVTMLAYEVSFLFLSFLSSSLIIFSFLPLANLALSPTSSYNGGWWLRVFIATHCRCYQQASAPACGSCELRSDIANFFAFFQRNCPCDSLAVPFISTNFTWDPKIVFGSYCVCCLSWSFPFIIFNTLECTIKQKAAYTKFWINSIFSFCLLRSWLSSTSSIWTCCFYM